MLEGIQTTCCGEMHSSHARGLIRTFANGDGCEQGLSLSVLAIRASPMTSSIGAYSLASAEHGQQKLITNNHGHQVQLFASEQHTCPNQTVKRYSLSQPLVASPTATHRSQKAHQS